MCLDDGGVGCLLERTYRCSCTAPLSVWRHLLHTTSGFHTKQPYNNRKWCTSPNVVPLRRSLAAKYPELYELKKTPEAIRAWGFITEYYCMLGWCAGGNV